MVMIIIIGLVSLVLLLVCLINIVIVSLKEKGYLKLYIEVDFDYQSMYGWYKGNIIESIDFSLNESGNEILLKKEKLIEKSLLKINKIKYLKSKL